VPFALRFGPPALSGAQPKANFRYLVTHAAIAQRDETGPSEFGDFMLHRAGFELLQDDYKMTDEM
jgi:hypothetical protein